jgi:competence protein ComEC
VIPRLPRAAWLAVGVAAGAAAGASGWPLAAAVAALLVLAAGQARGPVPATWRVPATAAGIGGILVAARLLLGPAAVPPPPLPEAGGPWEATVESVGSPRDGDQVARLRLSTDAGDVLVAATLPAFPVVTAGTVVEVDGRLRPPPDGDPYAEYLRRTGASGSLDARSLRVIRQPGFSLQAARDGAGDALRLTLPEPEAGLAAGILIGLRERVDRMLAADFATAGVSHVVAISGWNIAIVAGLVGAVLRGRPRRLVSVSVLGTVAAYVVAAGGSPSVVRAAVMAGVVLLARESGRAGRAAAALGAAAALLLLLDPALIGDAGFRLSVMATAGLLAWANPVGAWLGGLGGGRMPRWLAESLGISLAAQAATLPDVVATFGRLSLVSPLVNLAVVPLVPVAMAGGLLALLAGAASAAGAPAAIATLAGLPGWLVLHVIIWLVRVGAGVPFAAVTLPPQIALPVSLATAAAVVAAPSLVRRARGRCDTRSGSVTDARPSTRTASSVGARQRTVGPVVRLTPARRAVIVVAAIVVTLGGAAVGEATGRTTRITVLDVGQGDAILLETRTGARMLVDGGPDPDRVLIALDARIPPWDRRLDLLVLTHPHEDHVAGLARVLQRYRVGRVFEPGMRGPGPGWAAWSGLLRDGPPHGVLLTGARLRLGEVSMRVLWPDPGAVPLDPPNGGTAINNVSIVLLGEANGRRFLLAGDVEDGIDPTLLARGLPRVDFLKVAHHGSRTATTQAFVDAVRPRVAVASAGAGNTYGHPAPSTLARLRDSGARVLRTDQDGSVSVELLPSGVNVATTGARAASAPGARLARSAMPSAPPPAPAGPFACAIPIPAGSPLQALLGRADAGSARPAVAGSGDWAVPTGYDRGHDDPRSPRGRPPAALVGAAGLVPPALMRRRRCRELAGGAWTGAWSAARSRRRGGRGSAPRRRQAAQGTHGRAPPRRWVGGMAPGGRARRARPAGARPSRDPPRRRRLSRVVRLRVAGGADRRLRRQACGPAPGVDGREVRLVAPEVSRRLGRGDGGARAHARPGARGGRVFAGRRPARGRPAAALVSPCAGGGRVSDVPILAYYRGDDGWSLDRAADRVAERLQQDSGERPERWRVPGAEASAAAIGERVATAPLFGGGTVAVVVDPAPLLRAKAEREALEASLAVVAPGNALVFVEQGDAGSKRSAALQALEAAVLKAGGESRTFKAPKAGELAGWITARATERGMQLHPSAARELARRVGGFVNEGDVDRQRMGALAVAELDKLALYRPYEPVSEDDVKALVAEVVPDSTWAFLDAVAERRVAIAGPALDRLLETTPEPVITVQLHRRLRELLIAADLTSRRARPADIVKAIGGHPFRAQKLAEQARAWSVDELEDALEGVQDLDAMVKGAPDAGSTDRQRRLAFALWIGERIGPRRG